MLRGGLLSNRRFFGVKVNRTCEEGGKEEGRRGEGEKGRREEGEKGRRGEGEKERRREGEGVVRGGKGGLFGEGRRGTFGLLLAVWDICSCDAIPTEGGVSL